MMKRVENSGRWRAARRRVLGLIGLGSVTGPALMAGTVQAAQSAPASLKTPAETAGPFYPANWSGDVDANLLRLADGEPYANGTPLRLVGHILRADGSPAPGARVEIWQCDANGRYRHPHDAGEAPAEDGFQGYGQALTDTEGRYQFTTIKPVAYGSRPPHIHFRIQDGETALTTQMYFEGENQERSLFARFYGFASDRALLTVRTEPLAAADGARAGLQAQFDVFL